MACVPTKKPAKSKKTDVPICPKCGAAIKVGDWPWCPHQKLAPSTHLWNWVK
jgi:hypothetical protein